MVLKSKKNSRLFLFKSVFRHKLKYAIVIGSQFFIQTIKSDITSQLYSNLWPQIDEYQFSASQAVLALWIILQLCIFSHLYI